MRNTFPLARNGRIFRCEWNEAIHTLTVTNAFSEKRENLEPTLRCIFKLNQSDSLEKGERGPSRSLPSASRRG